MSQVQEQEQGPYTRYVFRMCVSLFLLAWAVELARLSCDDHSDYLVLLQQTPQHCISEKAAWSVTTSFEWMYTSMWEAPIKNDCKEFFRNTHRIKLYLPRIPQSLANVVSQFLFSPFETFLDKLGDALRRFMDKFNVAERMFGIIILLMFMVMFSLLLIMFVWTYRISTPQLQIQQPHLKYLTRSEEKDVKNKD